MRFGLFGFLATLLSLPPAASACNVPVFRFALERWNKRNADELYTLYVFHEGKLPDNLRVELDRLEARLEDGPAPANLVLYRLDTSRPIRDEAIARIHETSRTKLKSKAGTWMVLRFPDAWDLQTPLHVGPYDMKVIESWLHSPLRQKIARRILLGHSAVFLFLESGDKAKDDERYALAEKELARLEKEITLPELTDAPKDQLLRDDVPLKVSFALLRLSRTDAVEVRLLDMLCGMDSEGDIAAAKEPVLIAIYGRGIAMANKALFGKGIHADNIEGLARFLTGRCSCEIRRLNPGIDLLLAVNWDGSPPSEPEAEGSAGAGPSGVESSVNPASSGSGGWGLLLWTMGGVLLVLLLGTMLIVVRAGRGARG